MKKLLSIFLAIAMVVSITTVSLAVNERIKDVTKAIDTHAPVGDLDGVTPGTVIKFPLTADMFEWSSGKIGGEKEPVTQQDISRASIKPVVTGSSTDAIKDVKIKYDTHSAAGGSKTAIVEVTFEERLVSTSTKRFDCNLFLSTGSRKSNSRVRLKGYLENDIVTPDSGDSYVNVSGGKVIEPESGIRNLEIELGQGVVLKTNVFSGQKYYGYAESGVSVDDDKVLSKYPDISNVLRLHTVNLKKAGKYVDLTEWGTDYVYGQNGAYLGKAGELLEYSDVYYISGKDLGANISVGGNTNNSGSSNTNNNTNANNSNNTGNQNSGTNVGSGSVSGTVQRAEAVTATNTAITEAKNAGRTTAVVSLWDKAEITADALQGVQSTVSTASMSAQIQANTVVGNSVVGRITLFPQNTSNITGNIKLGAYNNNTQAQSTKTVFGKSFNNKIAVLSFDQDGSFGTEVQVAAKLDLSNFDKTNIYFYSYNRGTNTYYIIKNPNAWIDSNGYVRFTTSLAGDIIVSEGPLK